MEYHLFQNGTTVCRSRKVFAPVQNGARIACRLSKVFAPVQILRDNTVCRLRIVSVVAQILRDWPARVNIPALALYCACAHIVIRGRVEQICSLKARSKFNFDVYSQPQESLNALSIVKFGLPFINQSFLAT